MSRDSAVADLHGGLEDAIARNFVALYGAIVWNEELKTVLCQGRARSLCKFNNLHVTIN